MKSSETVPAAGGNLARVLLVGNPNVGKSVFFRLLTGRYVMVSNYPGTTVEVARGVGKLGGREVEVIDTPGANSLSPNSEDEKVARDVVLAAGEKTVVQVADAKNLRRALLLTAQLAELEVPMVLALNMWDEARDRGIDIDLDQLRMLLGVEVVPTVATERRGISRLFASIPAARPATFRHDYGEVIEKAAAEVCELLPEQTPGRRGVALMLLGRAPALEENIAGDVPPAFAEALNQIRRTASARLGRPVGLTIQQKRAAEADRVMESVFLRLAHSAPPPAWGRNLLFFVLGPALFYAVGWRLASFLFHSVSTGEPRFDALGALGSTLAVHGFGLLSLVLYSASMWRREYANKGSAAAALARLSCHPVGGFFLLAFVLWAIYQVVGVFGAGNAVDFIQNRVFGGLDEGTGSYGGLINGPLSRALESVTGRESLVYRFLFSAKAGLITTGLTYAFAIVFPIVTLFFLAFSLMEDSGYLPRLSLLADRIFKRVGLSGKAVLPMVLGLGCGAMATMTTRILETRRQRLIAILLLALAVPCSAQLGVITAVLAGISPVGVLVYAGVLVVAFFGAGWAAAKILPGEAADLFIEVPPFRWPRPENVVVKTYYRVKWFMREAVPLFLLGTGCLFVADTVRIPGLEQTPLKLIEAAAGPVVSEVLGLPVETTVGFILGFLRRDYATVVIFEQFKAGTVAANQALVALVVITLFVPCLAHFFVCVKELGWKKAVLLDILVLVLAIAAGAAVRLMLVATGLRTVMGS